MYQLSKLVFTKPILQQKPDDEIANKPINIGYN